MNTERQQLEALIAKEAIRELALLYCRGVDRKDVALLRTLYTSDATDTHGDTFDGGASAYVDFLEKSFPHMRYSGHHVCNHMISVDVDEGEGEGEVYAISYHVIPDGEGGWMEDLMCVRYIDHYRRERDGHWRFSKRVVTYDYRSRRPISMPIGADPQPGEASYRELTHRLFRQGARA